MYPIFAQTAGIVIWVFLALQSVEFLTSVFPQINIWLLWIAFLLANLPGMYLFFNGFWRYMVWVSALNLLVRELAEDGACNDVQAYAMRITCRPLDYSLILTFLFGMVFIPLGFSMIPIAIASSHPEWYWGCILAALIILSVGSIAVCTAFIFFVLVFQVFAFTPGSAGASLLRSMDLVYQNIGKTVLIIIVSIGVTQLIIPSIFVWIADVSHLTELISNGFKLLMQPLIQQAYADISGFKNAYPEITWIADYIFVNPQQIGVELAGTLVYTYISAFLLPLGTCWFALLYGDLKTRLELKELPVELSKNLAPLS